MEEDASPLFCAIFEIMINKLEIEQIVNQHFEGTNFFLVDVKVSTDNDIEVIIESDNEDINLDHCVKISRHIESQLDREKEDFSLTVGSAGLSSPFKVLRQYRKFIGQEVEVLIKGGIKLKAVLTDASAEEITLTYSKLESVEGKKKKVRVEHTDTYPM